MFVFTRRVALVVGFVAGVGITSLFFGHHSVRLGIYGHDQGFGSAFPVSRTRPSNVVSNEEGSGNTEPDKQQQQQQQQQMPEEDEEALLKRLKQEYYTRYNRPVPKMFPKWLKFAQAQKCVVEHNFVADDQFVPFYTAGGITPAMMDRSASSTFSLPLEFGGGNPVEINFFNNGYWVQQFANSLKSIPDLTEVEKRYKLILNTYDEPRSFLEPKTPGKFKDLCPNAPWLQIHGIADRGYGGGERDEAAGGLFLFPIFSPAGVRNCTADFLIPFASHLMQHDISLVPWDDKVKKLFWRGSTTGQMIMAYDPVLFETYHRFRAVRLMQDHPHADFAFSNMVQCDPQTNCDGLRSIYHFTNWVQLPEQWKHRYIFDIDGNSFSQRISQLVGRSGSLVFRAQGFNDWYDGLMIPWEHYVPVDFDLKNLPSLIEWAQQHDKESDLIRTQGQYFITHHAREEDMQCYIYRQLIHYMELVDLGMEGVNNV
jgi:hypothetical protein